MGYLFSCETYSTPRILKIIKLFAEVSLWKDKNNVNRKVFSNVMDYHSMYQAYINVLSVGNLDYSNVNAHHLLFQLENLLECPDNGLMCIRLGFHSIVLLSIWFTYQRRFITERPDTVIQSYRDYDARTYG